jgi:type II secretory ATPase GspE/PulE/Tfp pilus assembly ATPase PilB-like protein
MPELSTLPLTQAQIPRPPQAGRPTAEPAVPAGASRAAAPTGAAAGAAPRPISRRTPRSRPRTVFAWPTPPLAHYPLPQALTESEPCEVEGLGGNLLTGLLSGFDAVEGLIQLTLPNDAAAMPVRLSQLRRITLKTPLLPLDAGEPALAEASPSAPQPLVTTPGHLLADRELGGALLAHAERLPYELKLPGAVVLRGLTLGCVETDLGLFVFTPLDGGSGALQRSFFPRTAWESYELGERIGALLVEHQAVSEAAVEDVAREQQQLRSQRLGDVLLARQVVTTDQLLAALDKQARMPMVRLGEALVAMGAISDTQLQDALCAQQADRNLSLGELLLRRELINPADLQGALARKMGYPLVDLGRFTPDESALRLLDPKAALRLRALPLMKRGGRLVVALQDPGRRAQIDELQALTRCPIAPALANEAELLPAIAAAYRRLDPANSPAVAAALRAAQDSQIKASASAQTPLPDHPPDRAGAGPAPASAPAPAAPSSPVADGAAARSAKATNGALGASAANGATAALAGASLARPDNPLVSALGQVLLDALQRDATAVHIEVRPGSEPLRVRMRCDERLLALTELPVAWRATLVARIKSLCELDVTETHRPQQGRLLLSRVLSAHKLPREFKDCVGSALKVVTLPTVDGLEDMVLHLPTRARVLKLDQIGMAGDDLDHLHGLLDQPAGLLLCAGLPRSGRSTSLHAMAASLLRPERRVWSVEERVRLLQPDMRQSEFNARQPGACEAALLALRDADADVVLVDEMRDAGSARAALELALSGRLVLAALPARSAFDAVSRLVEQGLPPHDLAEGLLGVHHQRLVKRLCSHCRMSRSAKDAEVEDWLGVVLHGQYADDPLRFEQARAALRAEWGDRFGREGRLRRYQSPGCERCRQSGWRGRVALHELSVNHRALRRLIRASAPPWHFERLALQQAESEGHRSLRQDAVEKMLAGLISVEQMREMV